MSKTFSTAPCCTACGSAVIVKNGHNAYGSAQFACRACGARRVTRPQTPARQPAAPAGGSAGGGDRTPEPARGRARLWRGKRIKDTGDIFFAESDRVWILAGATVHVSMIGFDAAEEKQRILDGAVVNIIPANLSKAVDITGSQTLIKNLNIGFIGVSMHGPLDLEESGGLAMLLGGGNPNLMPNSDVVRPVLNALEITKGAERRWLVSFPPA